ncbi:nucleotide-diphospho-sugar transferase [Tanacetum coccineum]
MIQVKEMMHDNDLKNSKSKDKGSKSRSQSMDEQSHYKQDKTITRQSINVKRHVFNVIGDTEKFEERDLNIGGDLRLQILDIIPPLPTSGITSAGIPLMPGREEINYLGKTMTTYTGYLFGLLVEEIVAMECLVVNTPGVGPNPPPPTQEANAPAGNAPGKPSYAIVIGKLSEKKVNVRTLYRPGGKVAVNNPLILKKWHPDEKLLKEDVSTVPVWVKLHGVPVTAFREDGLSAITKLGTPLMLDSYTFDMYMQSESHYTCNVHVEYEWKPPRCSFCKVFGHIQEECPKNTGAGEKKIVKKPSQTSRGVLKGVEPTIEVSNSNPFDVLNSVDNDVEFGTNGGTTNLVNNEATSSGSSFMNIDNDGEFASNTPIGVKINKIER